MIHPLNRSHAEARGIRTHTGYRLTPRELNLILILNAVHAPRTQASGANTGEVQCGGGARAPRAGGGTERLGKCPWFKQRATALPTLDW